MDKSLIKNFIIIVLALVNAFLLYIVLNTASEERQADIYRKEVLENVLNENGISLNPDLELPDKVPSQVSLKRDNEKERKRISTLIGNCEATDKGGNIYCYIGADGQAQFRGTGEFEILLNSGVIAEGNDPIVAAKTALKRLDIAYSNDNPTVKCNGEATTIILYCAWKDTPIYNAEITFYFTNNSLKLISGSLPLDNEYQIDSSDNYLDSVTVLMNFLESVLQTGDVCSEISNLEIGYLLNSTVSGDCTLKPVWCIQTNSRAYYIDAQTGNAETVKTAAQL